MKNKKQETFEQMVSRLQAEKLLYERRMKEYYKKKAD